MYKDLDIDFADRQSIINYLSGKYGEDHVCQILNISYITPNVSIKDVGRVLGVPYNITDKISKKFVHETFEECMSVNSEIVSQMSEYNELFHVASKISGRVRNVSMHAGGVVVYDDNVTNHAAMKLGANGEHVIQVDKKVIERIGGIKFDILGVRTLKVVQDAMNMAGLCAYDVSINNPAFANDNEMYKILCEAKTNGVFQTESQGMKDLLVRLQPSSLEDVSAVLALYRPDSMPMLEEFIDNKIHHKRPTYIHDDMGEILDRTYGALIYQEQLMDIVRKFGGRSYGGADKFRKGIGKKDKALIKAESEKLYKEIIDNGYEESVARQISDMLSEKGGYLFNHCVSRKTTIMRGSAGNRNYIPTVEEMYKIKNDAKYAIETGHKDLHKKYMSKLGYGTALSMCDDNRIRVNRIIDIKYSGKRELFRVSTESGATIECTDNHKFPTVNGIKELKDICAGDELYEIGKYEMCHKDISLTNLKHSNNLPLKGQRGFQKQEYSATNNFFGTREDKKTNRCSCEVCGREFDDTVKFELHHKDLNRKNNDLDNFVWCCNSCHKKLHYQQGRAKRYQKGIPTNTRKVVSIESIGIDDVYDIEMDEPNHNFVTSTGIVTCNSHSALYSILTLKTAYLKAHYPAEFFCALLNQNLNDFGAINKYILEARDFNIEVLHPHINRSQREFSIYDGKILFGLSAIKGIGSSVVDAIMSERENGKFTNLSDLLSRVKLTTAQVVALIKAGAIPTKDKHNALLKYCEMILPEASEYKPVSTLPTKAKLLIEYGIDAGIVTDKDERLKLMNSVKRRQHEEKQAEKLSNARKDFVAKYMQDEQFWEFETLSVFISNNPFEKAARYLSTSFASINDGDKCTIVGVISSIQKKKDRNKNQYCFVNINSLDGFLELTAWSSQYKMYSEFLTSGNQIAVLVKKSDDKAIIEQVKPYSQWLLDRNIE